MIEFRLGVTKHKTLFGDVLEEKVCITRETGKAILLRIENRGKVAEHWIPKSVCTITDKSVCVAKWFYQKEMEQQ
ncbi:MAG: hypothetical protein GYA39_04585 [Methanothrix sp.]|nr:hypothetical protein [Methanothrix sp.]